MDDARKLRSLTHKLYSHLYAHYEEMEELNEMTDESLLLDIEIIEKKHEQEIAALQEELKRQQEEVIRLKKQLEEAHRS